MSLWAIGDLQGCYTPLQRLLAEIGFSPSRDRLWFVGDLVNRGPQSLECVLAVREWVESGVARTVLGNHDMHLLAAAAGLRSLRDGDTIAPILHSPHCSSVMQWLRRQPFLVEEGPFALCHAGVAPTWDWPQTQHYAQALSHLLSGDAWQQHLGYWFEPGPQQWWDCHTDAQRLRLALRYFTLVRLLHPDGSMAPGTSAPEDSPYQPWYQRQRSGKTLVFGHWAALGYRRLPSAIATDSGCVWGNALSAVCLDTNAYEVVSVAASD